ncbi:rRNA maturation RNase YbeY [Patescibacteria group bacterium]|nr:rRNA maturation RNase YbeY [Patescibacteria group bacterium]
MIKVYIKKQTNYPLKAMDIKKNIASFFKERGIVSDAVVSIALVGEKKMLDIGKKYLKDNKVHNVLSFTADEVKNLPARLDSAKRAGRQGKFVYPPGELLNLGEIVVCYPTAVEEAKKEGKLVKSKILELIEHGAEHLMGEHHE